jgi:hypothetical protein
LQNRYAGISVRAETIYGHEAGGGSRCQDPPDVSATIPQRTPSRAWATLDPMSFEQSDVDLLAAAEEIEIETQPPGGSPRRTTSWVMVDEGDAFVRSVRGPEGRWYRDAIANPAVAVIAAGRRLAATAIPADDPDSVDRINRALTAKYRGIPGYDEMLEPHVLEVNLRLEPA